MPKFKVTSGEFEIVINEKTLRKAGDAAIQIHDKSKHPSLLGELTLVEKLDRQTSKPIGDPFFISTQILLDEHTSGMGQNIGQYSRTKEE